MSDAANNSTQLLSTRRLQARAAKSAVRRVQDMYKNTAEATRELDKTVTDRAERNRIVEAMKQQNENEIQFLREKLTELIPTDKSILEEFGDGAGRIEQNQLNKLTMLRQPQSYVVQNLLDDSNSDMTANTTAISSLSPRPSSSEGDGKAYETSSDNDSDDEDNDDNEFIQEFLRRSGRDSTSDTTPPLQGGNDEDDNGNDGADAIETALA